jgi:hypothetical protein
MVFTTSAKLRFFSSPQKISAKFSFEGTPSHESPSPTGKQSSGLKDLESHNSFRTHTNPLLCSALTLATLSTGLDLGTNQSWPQKYSISSSSSHGSRVSTLDPRSRLRTRHGGVLSTCRGPKPPRNFSFATNQIRSSSRVVGAPPRERDPLSLTGVSGNHLIGGKSFPRRVACMVTRGVEARNVRSTTITNHLF